MAGGPRAPGISYGGEHRDATHQPARLVYDMVLTRLIGREALGGVGINPQAGNRLRRVPAQE